MGTMNSESTLRKWNWLVYKSYVFFNSFWWDRNKCIFYEINFLSNFGIMISQSTLRQWNWLVYEGYVISIHFGDIEIKCIFLELQLFSNFGYWRLNTL